MAYKGKKYKNYVEVTCKDCGDIVKKEKYTLKKWGGRCHPCSRVFVCRSRANKTENDPILRKIYIEVSCKTCEKKWQKRQDSLVKWEGECMTCSNTSKDTEGVKLRERARKEMYSLIHSTLKRVGHKKEGHSVDLLGYSAMDLYNHINNNLKEGMSWSNRGSWHIDHKKPVSAFINEGILDPKIINDLGNLEPLWALDNLSKSSNWTVIGQ